MILAGLGRRRGYLGDLPAPEDRSILEALLGEKPGYLKNSLNEIKTLLVLSTVVTIGASAAVLISLPKGHR